MYCGHLTRYFEIPSEAQMRGRADETKSHNIFDEILHMAAILFSDSCLALGQVQQSGRYRKDNTYRIAMFKLQEDIKSQ